MWNFQSMCEGIGWILAFRMSFWTLWASPSPHEFECELSQFLFVLDSELIPECFWVETNAFPKLPFEMCVIQCSQTTVFPEAQAMQALHCKPLNVYFSEFDASVCEVKVCKSDCGPACRSGMKG